jgi:hypothetical protein
MMPGRSQPGPAPGRTASQGHVPGPGPARPLPLPRRGAGGLPAQLGRALRPAGSHFRLARGGSPGVQGAQFGAAACCPSRIFFENMTPLKCTKSQNNSQRYVSLSWEVSAVSSGSLVGICLEAWLNSIMFLADLLHLTRLIRSLFCRCSLISATSTCSASQPRCPIGPWAPRFSRLAIFLATTPTLAPPASTSASAHAGILRPMLLMLKFLKKGPMLHCHYANALNKSGCMVSVIFRKDD